MTPAEHKARIRQLNEEGNRKRQEAHALAESCPHKIVLTDKKHDSAVCEGCDRDFGWYCPDSPDHICHYSICEGKLELIDGTEIDAPAGHDADLERLVLRAAPEQLRDLAFGQLQVRVRDLVEIYDTCIYCGHPDERK